MNFPENRNFSAVYSRLPVDSCGASISDYAETIAQVTVIVSSSQLRVESYWARLKGSGANTD